MIQTNFKALHRLMHPNRVLLSMSYYGPNNELSITFKTGQVRIYECDDKLAYGLFYCTSAINELQYYSTKIKGQCRVLNVR